MVLLRSFYFTYINHSRPWCSLMLGSVFSSVMVPVECPVLTLFLCSICNTEPNGRCESVRKSHELFSSVLIKLGLSEISLLLVLFSDESPGPFGYLKDGEFWDLFICC